MLRLITEVMTVYVTVGNPSLIYPLIPSLMFAWIVPTGIILIVLDRWNEDDPQLDRHDPDDPLFWRAAKNAILSTVVDSWQE